jgi:hypothetical protein
MDKSDIGDCVACKHFEGCKGPKFCLGFISKSGVYWRDEFIQEAIEEIEAMEKGQKHDEGKPDWHCVPLEVVALLVPVFEAGIKKGYGRFNCLQPFDDADRRFYSGKMRHTAACQLDPLAKDEETGCYHEAQAAFNALMRLYHALRVKK